MQSAYIASNIAESHRLAAHGRDANTPRAPVVPFGELYYHGSFGPNASSLAASTSQPRSQRTSNSLVDQTELIGESRCFNGERVSE